MRVFMVIIVYYTRICSEFIVNYDPSHCEGIGRVIIKNTYTYRELYAIKILMTHVLYDICRGSLSHIIVLKYNNLNVDIASVGNKCCNFISMHCSQRIDILLNQYLFFDVITNRYENNFLSI